MNEVASFLQNLDAFAFVLLGLVIAISWARRPKSSFGWLALAIVLLSSVSLLGRIPLLLHVSLPLLSVVSLIALVGSGYGLLRYRASVIPLPPRWHVAAVVAMAAVSVAYLAAQHLAAAGAVPVSVASGAAIALVLVWSATVGEPIFRFWLVSRGLPAVQAWRLRSLSIGFAGIVAILLFAVGAREAAANPAVRIATQLIVLLIVPLLYVSFSPPALLRRQWRASEEEELRAFMQDLLQLREDQRKLAGSAVDWAMRLVGAGSAVTFAADGSVQDVRGLDQLQVEEVRNRIAGMRLDVNRIPLRGAASDLLLLPLGVDNDAGRLAILAGPFTPGFGADEISRVQQFMSAAATALDRARLLDRLKEANASLLEVNKHKSVFLASMSHELRTPLNAILGFSELMIDATNGQYPDATKKSFLEQIHASGKHLLELINDILDLSKIEAGQMELRLESVSVDGVVGQGISTIQPLAELKQVRIDADVGSAGDIEADAIKFKQMLLNLLSNAIKFTTPGGTVKVTAQRLADAVEIAVADTGIGIAQSDQTRIFHEFQQVDSGYARQQQGTGLGLSLTRRFAMLHGGDVRVQSELGRGSVFTLRMPLVAVQPERRHDPRDVADQRNRDPSLPLVLVVEDDPPAAELLTRQIERAAFRTEIVAKGSEVLAKARALQPAVITLDILLPDIDGWEVLTRLKKDKETSAIPVIVISILENSELCVALGALDYFVKPVLAEELLKWLSRFQFGGHDGIRVLVVDDEQANRELMAEILKSAGYRVTLAAGGREAIGLARSTKPDLVVLDLMMPDVSGFDVVEALRADEATRATPVMVVTGKDLTDGEKRRLNGQVSKILRRGSTGSNDLLVELRAVMAQRAAEAAAAVEQ